MDECMIAIKYDIELDDIETIIEVYENKIEFTEWIVLCERDELRLFKNAVGIHIKSCLQALDYSKIDGSEYPEIWNYVLSYNALYYLFQAAYLSDLAL